MVDYPELFVLRHGQTEWNAAGRHQGRLDSPLTQKGLAQAADQGVLLGRHIPDWSGVDLFCSPQGRASATAGIALEALDRRATEDARLMEISFCAWEGKTQQEVEVGWPEIDHDGDPFDWHFYAPGGESFEEVSSRAQSFLDDLTRSSVIVTHGITSRVLRGLWLGTDKEGMAAMPGGQGCVHHLFGGQQTQLSL